MPERRALIIQGDDPIFSNATLLLNDTLVGRGYATTVARSTADAPLSREMALQALGELGLRSIESDSLLLLLHCHGSPTGISPSGTTTRQHRCCLNSGCSSFISMADLEAVVVQALPAHITIVDRSCYSGNTVLALGASTEAAARDTCAISASSQTNFSYWGTPEFAPFLGAPEMTKPRDVALHAQMAFLSRRPLFVDQRVFASGCAGTMGLRNLLAFVRAPIFPYDQTLSKSQRAALSVLNDNAPSVNLGSTAAFTSDADPRMGLSARLGLLRPGWMSGDSELEAALTALDSLWSAAPLADRLDGALTQVRTTYDHGSLRPSTPWPTRNDMVSTISTLVHRLQVHRQEMDQAADSLAPLALRSQAFNGPPPPPSMATRRPSGADDRWENYALTMALADVVIGHLNAMRVDARDLNILLSVAEDAMCAANDGPCSVDRR